MKLKGRYIPDDKVEIAPFVVDIPRGEGMTQLMVLGPEEQPKKEIECFHWDWPEPKRKPKTWVLNSVMVASIIGSASVFALFFIPDIATPVLLSCLGWLGFVAFANIGGSHGRSI